MKGSGAYEEVDLRQFLFQIFSVALWKTTGDDKEATQSLPFIPGKSENGIDRLFRRIFDKGARVDDEDLRLRRIGGEGVSGPGKEAKHHLRIDKVLRTSQTDKANRFFH